MAIEQIEQLRLQRGARPVGVEVGEERVFRIFEYQCRIESRCEPLGQRRLAGPERSFDGDVVKIQRPGV